MHGWLDGLGGLLKFGGGIHVFQTPVNIDRARCSFNVYDLHNNRRLITINPILKYKKKSNNFSSKVCALD